MKKKKTKRRIKTKQDRYFKKLGFKIRKLFAEVIS